MEKGNIFFGQKQMSSPWYSLLTRWSVTKRHPRIQFRPIVFFAEVEDELLWEKKDYLWNGSQLLVASVCRCDGALMWALIRALPDMESRTGSRIKRNAYIQAFYPTESLLLVQKVTMWGPTMWIVEQWTGSWPQKERESPQCLWGRW